MCDFFLILFYVYFCILTHVSIQISSKLVHNNNYPNNFFFFFFLNSRGAIWLENNRYTPLKELKLDEISIHLSDSDYPVLYFECIEYLEGFFFPHLIYRNLHLKTLISTN